MAFCSYTTTPPSSTEVFFFWLCQVGIAWLVGWELTPLDGIIINSKKKKEKPKDSKSYIVGSYFKYNHTIVPLYVYLRNT